MDEAQPPVAEAVARLDERGPALKAAHAVVTQTSARLERDERGVGAGAEGAREIRT